MIAEFPGCIAQGDDPSEAYANLEDAAEAWLESAIENGLLVPDPEVDREENSYSGRVVLRMARSLHRDAVQQAKNEGISLNAFLLTAISMKLGQDSVRRELSALRRELLEAVREPLLIGGMAVRREAPTPPGPVRTWDVQPVGNAGTATVESYMEKYLTVSGAAFGWQRVGLPQPNPVATPGDVRRFLEGRGQDA
jgi:predicted RNase H-like HicB family nuclease